MATGADLAPTQPGRETAAEALDIPAFLDDFLAFEVQHGLFARRSLGEPFWDYIRYAVSSYCIYSRYAYEEPRGSTTTRVVGETKANLLYLARQRLRTRKRYDLLFANYARTGRIGDRHVNIHTYPVIAHMTDRARILLVDPQPLSQPVEPSYPCDVLRSRPSHVIDRARARTTTFPAAERAMFQEIGDAIERHYHVKLDIESIARELFVFQIYRRRWFRRVLARHQPKVVLYCDDANQKGLIAAARELGIPTVDMQHSLISSSNIVYRYPQSIDRPLPTMSDYIFTFGDFWNDRYGLPAGRKSVGWPYFERLRDDASRKAAASTDPENGVIVIGMVFSKDELIRLTLDLAARLPGHTIYYKLRPEDYAGWRDRYPAEFSSRRNLVVIDTNDTPLYEWFSRCRYQVGINSTALCEGLALGLTTFVLKVGWYREMAHFYDAGHMFLVSEAREAADVIARRGRAPVSLAAEALFKPGALANIDRAIDEVIAERAH